MAFLFQIAGSGFGYVWALILLEVRRTRIFIRVNCNMLIDLPQCRRLSFQSVGYTSSLYSIHLTCCSNRFGIICLLLPYAFALMYVFYEMPKFFIAALLALNGTGGWLLIHTYDAVLDTEIKNRIQVPFLFWSG